MAQVITSVNLSRTSKGGYIKFSIAVFQTLLLILSCNCSIAAPRLFFNTHSSGSPANVRITLCLNGEAQLSCQTQMVSSLQLTLMTTIPNHLYPAAGIKVNTPGYELSGCSQVRNGYCIFTVSDTTPATINLSNISYNIVIDAGSSGTRAHLYKITLSSLTPLIEHLFDTKVSIPLASFANHPADAWQAIQPLLTDATAELKALHISTTAVPATVMGTAGMRLISSSSQAEIYRVVATTIISNHYKLGQTRTITGQEEGFYQWLDVNYLNGSLGTTNTTGIIEMGGASTQLAFVTNSTPNSNIINLNIDGTPYHLYSITFLGLGVDQARTSMNALPAVNDCYPVGYSSGSINGSYTYSTCANNYNTVQGDSAFAVLSQLHSLAGFSSQPFYGISNIYDVLKFLDERDNPTPSSVAAKVISICANTYAQLEALYPDQEDLFNVCADSTYVESFLYSATNGLNFGSNTLLPIKSINDVKTTWALGYVYLTNKRPAIL